MPRSALSDRRARRSAPRTGAPLAVVGPTASGKTEASLVLAEGLDAEIVTIDSMSLYRGMDVGTAKPGPDDIRRVRHHLLDVAEPVEPFSVAAFQDRARAALADIRRRGRAALLVGGSGLYYRAVVDDLEFPGTDPATRAALEAEGAAVGPERLHRRLAAMDPDAAAKIDPPNLRRTVRALEVAAITGRPFSSYATGWDRYPPGRVRAAGVEVATEALRARIRARVERMVEGGLLEEARALLDRGFGPFLTSSQAIGYLEAVQHLEGRLSLDEAMERIARRTRALARRQMAWFRRDPRIRWFPAGREGAGEIVDRIEEHLRA